MSTTGDTAASDVFWKEAYKNLRSDPKSAKTLDKYEESLYECYGVKRPFSEGGRAALVNLIKKKNAGKESSAGDDKIDRAVTLVTSAKEIIAGAAAAASPFASIPVTAVFMIFEAKRIFDEESDAMYTTYITAAEMIKSFNPLEQRFTRPIPGEDPEVRALKDQLRVNIVSLYQIILRSLAKVAYVLNQNKGLQWFRKTSAWDKWQDNFNYLKYAGEKCDKDIMRLHIKLNSSDPGAYFSYADGIKVFHQAAIIGSKDLLLQWIPFSDVNERTADGSTALMLAAKHGHTEIVAMLLGTGRVNINEQNNDDQTALIVAVKSKQPVYTTDERKRTEIVKQLIQSKADVSIKDKRGRTAWLWAAQYGQRYVLGALYRTKAIDVNHTTYNGWTALHLLAESGYITGVKFLLDLGADRMLTVRTGYREGFTARGVARRARLDEETKIEVIKILETYAR